MSCATCPSLFHLSTSDKKNLESLLVPIPSCEGKRILYLRQSNVLDSAPEESYDRITRMCSRHFKTEIALVSLLDISRQWFKSRVGLDATQTHRDLAFCSYAILEETPRVMVVPNASLDPRFKENALVVGHPHIRFYAGASLIVEGVKIGSLCIIDSKPRSTFSDHDAQTLIFFAELVANLISDERNRGLEKLSNGVYMHQRILSTVQLPLQAAKNSYDTMQLSWNNLEPTKNSTMRLLKDADQYQQAVDKLEQVLESSLRAMEVEEHVEAIVGCHTSDIFRASNRSSEMVEKKLVTATQITSSPTVVRNTHPEIGFFICDWEKMCLKLLQRYQQPVSQFVSTIDNCDSLKDAAFIEEFHSRRWFLRSVKGHNSSSFHSIDIFMLCLSTIFTHISRCSSSEVSLKMNIRPHSQKRDFVNHKEIEITCFSDDDYEEDASCRKSNEDENSADLAISILIEDEHSKILNSFSGSERVTAEALIQSLHGVFQTATSSVMSNAKKCTTEFSFVIPIISMTPLVNSKSGLSTGISHLTNKMTFALQDSPNKIENSSKDNKHSSKDNLFLQYFFHNETLQSRRKHNSVLPFANLENLGMNKNAAVNALTDIDDSQYPKKKIDHGKNCVDRVTCSKPWPLGVVGDVTVEASGHSCSDKETATTTTRSNFSSFSMRSMGFLSLSSFLFPKSAVSGKERLSTALHKLSLDSSPVLIESKSKHHPSNSLTWKNLNPKPSIIDSIRHIYCSDSPRVIPVCQEATGFPMEN